MNKNKFNLRNVVAIAICLVGLMAFVGCESKTDLVEENCIVGKWIAAGNDHNHIEDGGFIVFMDNSGFETSFFGMLGIGSITYSLSENEITITFHNHSLGKKSCYTFEYVLHGNLLTIKHFSGLLSPSQPEKEITDVHFTRVQ